MTPLEKENLLLDLHHFDLADDKWQAIYNLRNALVKVVEAIDTEEVVE